jgi:hypothetical protein
LKKIKLNNSYELKVELTSDAYLYAFYYESEDSLRNYIYLINPLGEEDNRLFKAGIHKFPNLTPSPPASRQALVKLVATKERIPFSATKVPLSGNQVYYYLSKKEADNFVFLLDKKGKDGVCTTQFLYEIEK